MIPRWLIVAVVAVEAVVLLVAACAIVGHSAWHLWEDRRRIRHGSRGRRILAQALDANQIPPDTVRGLESLPRPVREGLIRDTAKTLTGHGRRRLAAIADSLGFVRACERRCASRVWWRRLHAARDLTLLGTGERVMPALLDDPNPYVRAQAAEWAAEHPTPEVVAHLLALLAEEENLARFTVMDSLMRIGPDAVEPIRHHLARHTGREAGAALTVAAGLWDMRLLPSALALCEDPLPRTRAAAATLVGTLGGGPGADRLVRLLDDPEPPVRAAAARALGQVEHWPAAAVLGERLRDPAWDVRREAALALRNLGPTGRMVLNRARRDEDRFASDMARQVLDLPETGNAG